MEPKLRGNCITDWNLEGKLVNATYCGIAVEGWVKRSFSQYGGTVGHLITLTQPVKILDRVELEEGVLMIDHTALTQIRDKSGFCSLAVG